MAYDFYKAPQDDNDFDVYVMGYPLQTDTYPMLKVNTNTKNVRGVRTMMAPEYISGLEFCSAKDKQRVFKVFGGRDKLHERMQSLINKAQKINLDF